MLTTQLQNDVLRGLRVLRQDPVETLISFICSSNNNIARISNMIDALCYRFGRYVGHVGDIPFHSFPSLDDIAAIKEAGAANAYYILIRARAQLSCHYLAKCLKLFFLF